ncbi:hypothetical protein H4R18_002415 [Coemansia javaensis]|uniref:F-box domain-containing protein n=1 Tax=Coemansia javaensis TaxID=2761396 RepID=A0A9W8H9R4_9FUNG|nr:hypothetical protein H4R18_002415 [Coemansia javaensis]
MYLCDLPNEVLSLVLRAPAKKVKENLSLLLVCKKWRSLALPYVYSEVHIEYGTWADASTEDTGGEPEDVKMTSNLDAVASVDCVRTARNLRIHVHYNLDPFPGLTRVVQTMRDAAEVWRGARVLDIAMHPNYRHPSYNTNVASRHPITVSPDCLFKQLRKASIDYDYRDGYQHPRTDPARLEELRLLNWPANHSWTPFSTDTGAMEIELPCLKRLDLLYNPLVQVPPESVTCLSLTRLMIAAPTSLDAMLELIRKLPNLTSLGLWKLALNEIQADISVPEPGENCVVEPLDTKLKSLGINVNQNEPSWEMIVPVVKYLLLWIPTLEKFRAMHAPKKPIMDFVGEYLAWYPHLEGIGFTLNDSDDLFRNKNCGSIE